MIDKVLENAPRIPATDRMSLKLTDDGKDFDLLLSYRDPAWNVSGAAKAIVKRLPQKKEIGSLGNHYHVPVTDAVVMVITGLWPASQLEASDEARIALDYWSKTMEQQRKDMERAAKYHEYCERRNDLRKRITEGDLSLQDELEALGDGFEYCDVPRLTMGENPMMLHQVVATMNSRRADGYGYFMVPGTGKTLCVVEEIDREASKDRSHLPKKQQLFKSLLIAPKNVRHNWASEIQRFSQVDGRVIVLEGWEGERVRLLLEGIQARPGQRYTTFISSYELLSNMWQYLSIIKWHLAGLDEGHFIKWPKTKRARFAFKLRDVSERRRVLTGTPVCNTPVDLYSLFEFMREGGSGFSNFEAFKNFYGVFQISADGGRRMVDVQNLPFLRDRLARMSFIVTKAEALPDLPKKTYDFVDVEMTTEQRQFYQMMKNKLLIEIEDDMADQTKTVNANNILVKLLRLAQITSGFVSFDPIVDLDTGEMVVPKTIQRITPNPKVEALVQQIKGFEDDDDLIEPLGEDEKMIVWACFMEDIATISERLSQESIGHVVFTGNTGDDDRRAAEWSFNNDPQCRVFLGNPAAGGTGLNLIGHPPGDESIPTDVTRVIFFSQGWSSVLRSQAEDRAHRRGTRRPVRCTDLIIMGTIDQEVRERVIDKRRMANDIGDLRSILGKLLGGDSKGTDSQEG